MMLTRLVAVALVAALGSGMAVAGTTGKIVGEVKDAQTGEALVGASVVVEGTRLGAATNIDGYYVILNVPPGKYTLAVSAVGYVRKRVSDLSVSVDLTSTANFNVTSEAVQVGEEVVVTAERPVVRKDLTSSEARVDAATIATMPVQEVREVVQLQAGVTVGSGGEIHIRGGRANEVAYWVDGISVSDAYDRSQTVQVDNNAVQELQVISGTFNAEYGSAMSGIVNIVTKEGQQKYAGSLSTYFGDYITGDGYTFDDRTVPLYDPSMFGGPTPGIFYNLNDVAPFDNYNVEGSVSGPVGFQDMTFYLSGRYFQSRGWLYGNKVVNPDGSLVGGYTVDDVVIDENGYPSGVRLHDNPASMNGRKRLSGQAKLTIPITGAMKMSLSGIASKIDYRDYSHSWFLMPDYDVQKFDKAYNAAALFTHSVGSSAFYTINGAYSYKSFREYLFPDPFDVRYVADPNATTTDLYEWITSGTNNHRFQRRTETVVGKIDYTDQLSRLHQIKAGVEFRHHRLYLEDYTLVQATDTSGQVIVPERTALPELNSPSYLQYTRQPMEFAVYIQDKLEYERMIVNVGFRLDWFDPNAQILADPNDPNVYLPRKPENQPDPGQTEEDALAERKTYWYKDASKKWYVSPRLGISYPITDRGILHFSYGHFLQIPSFDRLYDNPEWKVSSASGIQGVYGNPDLRPEQTISYEFGLQQQMSDVLSFDITMFYRDTRNWVATSTPIPVGNVGTNTSSYTTFVNKDYANSRGVTLSLIKRQSDLFSFNLTYMYQVAEGNNSNPDDEQAAQQQNREPARSLTPLNWDQVHTANLSLGIGEQDWGVNIIGRYGSGLPYTPTINQAEARGEDASRAVQNNSRRRPDQLNFDLRLFKNFRIEPLTLGVFCRVFNLFDARNEVDVYTQTGRATATPQALGVGNVNQPGRANTVEAYLVQPQFYSEPREIQLGVELLF